MEVKVQTDEEHQRLLIEDEPTTMDRDRRTLIQKAINQTFQSTAHLANLLPTGTVLAFQLLSPIFSNQGRCDPVCRFMTACLVSLCGFSCFFSSFTDSFRDESGKVRYALATPKGLWVIDGEDVGAALPPDELSKYKLKTIDFVHAFLSILVFAAIALFDQSVVQCFYPTPSEETQEVLAALPVGIGVICSMLFLVFPTTRHGIGFPITSP
ncbi:protein DMP4-like [Aristolochia californica]|uniref:protein DMP4-like n=1 Tax=Aristolochia californica TaxID=171875 RepID=UPI0035E2B180